MIKKLFRKKSIIFPALLSLILVVISASSAWYLGFEYGATKSKNIIIKGISDAQNPADVKASFNIFWQAWDLLKAKHIHGDKFNEQDAVQGAIRGLAGSFDDPYTTYFNPQESKAFAEEVRGNFGGVGMEIGIKNDFLIIISPLKGSPAERAGLQAKDYIVKINDEPTNNLSVEEAVKRIRGDVGTNVTLTILREGWENEKDFVITREVIQIPTIDWKFIDNKIMHLQLYSFNQNVESLFTQAISEGLSQGARGMVLDMRNNPGGYLEVAVDLAGWFMDKGRIVVHEEFSSGFDNIFRAAGNAKLKDFPVVVLINGGSASAAEILAGALRDERGIKLVGTKSFGKGSVQELVPLADGSTLKVTIAKWLLPKGTAIDKNGLEADYKVELPEGWTKDKPDPQLNKAIELLKGQIK